MSRNTPTPELEAQVEEIVRDYLIAKAADRPVRIGDGDKGVIVMSEEFYAQLLDKVQEAESADVVSDPLLNELADEFGPKQD